MAFNNCLTLAAALLAASATGCREKCRPEWEALASSRNGQAERARAEKFSECVLDRGLLPEYTVTNPASGAVLSDAELVKHKGPVRVQMDVTFRWKRERFVWMATSVDSVWPLFRE